MAKWDDPYRSNPRCLAAITILALCQTLRQLHLTKLSEPVERAAWHRVRQLRVRRQARSLARERHERGWDL